MSKRPAFQFYPGDWRTDPGLRLCSIAARGLWIEMMTLMHEGEPYGHLTIQARPIGPDMLARISGEAPSIIKRLLKELATNEVYSISPEGLIFSRRMVRDEEARERRAEGGKAGAEHGHKGGEHGKKGGRPAKEKTPLPEEARGDNEPPIKPPPSSSSSSSSSSPASQEVPLGKPNGCGAAFDPVKIMFDSGVALLGEYGKSEGTARTWLGKAKGAHGAEAVIAAIGAAKREGSPDPIAFMEGIFRQRARSLPEPVIGIG